LPKLQNLPPHGLFATGEISTISNTHPIAAIIENSEFLELVDSGLHFPDWPGRSPNFSTDQGRSAHPSTSSLDSKLLKNYNQDY
jgi:hypothetical protein